MKGEYGARVVIVSVLEDGPIPKRVLAAGASAYVGKGGNPDELVDEVRAAARGKRYLARTVAQNLALSNLGGGGTPFDGLKRRELVVALLLPQRFRTEDVAKHLRLHAKTTNNHTCRLFQNLRNDAGRSRARVATTD